MRPAARCPNVWIKPSQHCKQIDTTETESTKSIYQFTETVSADLAQLQWLTGRFEGDVLANLKVRRLHIVQRPTVTSTRQPDCV